MSDRTDSYTERMWLEDSQVETPEGGELVTSLQDYFEQGHMIVQFHVGEHSPGRVWFAVCTCGDTSWGGHRDHPPTSLLTYWDVKWWSRNHRAGLGLDWQDWYPAIPGQFDGAESLMV